MHIFHLFSIVNAACFLILNLMAYSLCIFLALLFAINTTAGIYIGYPLNSDTTYFMFIKSSNLYDYFSGDFGVDTVSSSTTVGDSGKLISSWSGFTSSLWIASLSLRPSSRLDPLSDAYHRRAVCGYSSSLTDKPEPALPLCSPRLLPSYS